MEQPEPILTTEPSPSQPLSPMTVRHDGPRPPMGLGLYLGIGTAIFYALIWLDRLVPDRGASALWIQLVTHLVLVTASLGSAVLMSRIEKRPFASYGLPLGRVLGKNFWVGVYWGLVALSALMLAMHAVGVLSFGRLALHGIRIYKFASFWGLFFLLVGVFEEFTFRGYALHHMTRAIGFWPAALALSAVFGALHLVNPGEAWVGALAAAVIGLFFCFTVRRTGNLWFAVGMHAAWDWGESYLFSVPDSGGVATGHLVNTFVHGPRWLTGGSVGPEGSILVFVIVGLVWLVFNLFYPKSQHEPN